MADDPPVCQDQTRRIWWVGIHPWSSKDWASPAPEAFRPEAWERHVGRIRWRSAHVFIGSSRSGGSLRTCSASEPSSLGALRSCGRGTTRSSSAPHRTKLPPKRWSGRSSSMRSTAPRSDEWSARPLRPAKSPGRSLSIYMFADPISSGLDGSSASPSTPTSWGRSPAARTGAWLLPHEAVTEPWLR